MDLAELSDSDQLTRLVARNRAFDIRRNRWRQPVHPQWRKVRPEPVADELVDVDRRVEPDDVEPPERFRGPPGLSIPGERILGDRRQEDLSGMGDGDQPRRSCQRRPDRLLAYLEVADVD